MRQVLLVVDIQSTFNPPEWLVDGVQALSMKIPTIASIELHDEQATPFQRQLGWSPASTDKCLIKADRVFVKNGYGQTLETIKYIKALGVDRVLVCGIQTETCVLAAGFALFDAGLTPTLITDLTVGSSLDRSGQLGIDLWAHHFRNVTTADEVIAGLSALR
ncbi:MULTISPECIES: isochorismatase family protein [Pseudomonas]|uniref:Amidases related to nicotinamidase n=2 Tax=Pseudomonas TaxID=286 RepID=A0A2L1KEU5_PSEAI|nr:MULTISPECIES: isochorismatase family protein [Pseudomonas]ANP63285.1 hydrolase [Pseudomonas aeruginosa]ASU52566.1 ISPpu30 transposase Orf4 [Pseudomonas putida]AVE20753.1 Amidases related to nicotinamidase [Pseudomonas aeruginosa]MBX5640184.1 cysteine hydrolase [Pseudomonas aeruginosa]MBX5879004.1 cysteine hydrolase [Pseudomonas aeruginosa]